MTGLAPGLLICLGLACLSWTAAATATPLPQRNLVVEVRAVAADAGEASGDAPARAADFSVGTSRSAAAPAPVQKLLVLNGAWAAMRFDRDLPIQWLRAAAQGSAPASAGSGATSGRRGGAIVAELSWLQAGQALAVQPQWPGGDRPVTLLIRCDTAAVDESITGSLPVQRRQQAGTTLVLPLGRWTTFAASGPPLASAAGATSDRSWSTQPASGTLGQALQVRVRLP